ncbi:MAG: YXWGXW repeat-containing protein [Flavobacteriales bacterium]|nr:YXWGXW repeat-containing protein [Flavobacteriales bacterium]
MFSVPLLSPFVYTWIPGRWTRSGCAARPVWLRANCHRSLRSRHRRGMHRWPHPLQ